MNKNMLKKIGLGVAGAILIAGSVFGIRKASKKEYVKVDTPSDEKEEKEEQKEEES